MTDMPVLYFAPQTCARVTLTALEEVGRPFETRLIAFRAGEHRSDAYLAMNPSGKVPTLDTGKGIVTQNGAILLYLAQTFPEAKLLPLSDDLIVEAAAVSALFRLSSDLHPLVTRFVLPGMILATPEAAPKVRAKADEMLRQQFQPIATQLRDRQWLMGDAWSILDAYLAWIWFRITGAGFDPTDFPTLGDHYARAGDRPSAKAALVRERLAEEELAWRGLSFAPPKLGTR